MTEDEVLAEFRVAGALLEGHFILSSGLRSPRYLQCARVLMDGARAERLARALAGKLSAEKIDLVVSPAMGGVIIGHEMGRALGVPAMFVERPDGVFGLRRGFAIEPGQRVLMVEDVVTTGLSSREAIAAIEAAGGKVVAAASLVDRSNDAVDLGVPYTALIRLDVPTFAADDLPPALAAIPAVKPGEPRGMILLGALLAAAPIAGRVEAVAKRAGLAGEVLVAKGKTVLLDEGFGPLAPGTTSPAHRAGEQWRLASITKQVTAALLVRDRFELLDRPITRIDHEPLPGPTLNVTLRQLLTHHSGLANPDARPLTPGGIPYYYARPSADLGYCLSRPAVPGPFSYNNCDYIVAAAEFGGIDRWPAGMRMARVGETGVAGFVSGRPEPRYELASFGAAGGLMGSARAVFAFDRSLLRGHLLTFAQRAELWKPEGGRSYQALGQWIFPGQLKGCVAPKRIVQRDGEIGGVQARNFILPDDDLVVIVFTNRSSDDFPIGEVWQGKGFAYDLLSAAACP